jgi:hypothetical protein
VASSSLLTKVGGSINTRGGVLTVANGGTGLILGPCRLEVGPLVARAWQRLVAAVS